MPNLAIVGYGKMGRLIEVLAPEYGFAVTARIDVDRDESMAGADVAVEFSTPGAVLDNIRKLAAARVPIVVGTTGWNQQLAEAKSIIESNNSALVWSPNFSVGVNVFTRLVSEAARLLKNEKEYGAWAWEIRASAAERGGDSLRCRRDESAHNHHVIFHQRRNCGG